jgi:16S rRNA (guanine966-N2)-methyltransferase
MRVIGGHFKGRRLEAPAWEGLRPTSDKLRETLFNVLAPAIANARVLDAFAGTGAVGIEALSRGAAHVTFVERDARAARLIERNLSHMKMPGDAKPYVIIRAELADAARQLAGQPFDIVFLDPPYGADDMLRALQAAESLLQPGSRLVLEHARRDAAPERTGTLVRTRELNSGDSALAFYSVRVLKGAEGC